MFGSKNKQRESQLAEEGYNPQDLDHAEIEVEVPDPPRDPTV